MERPDDKKPQNAEHTGEMVENADVSTGRVLASRRHHPVIDWISKAGEIGDQGPLYLIGTTVAVAGLLRKDPRCMIAGVAVVAAVGVADLMKSSVKGTVKRTRPDHAIKEDEYRFEPGGSGKKEEQSFPSGHTACTVAAVETAVDFYPGTAPYLRSACFLMASSRVAKGSHWPLDLLGGWVIGLISKGVVRRLILPRLVQAARMLKGNRR